MHTLSSWYPFTNAVKEVNNLSEAIEGLLFSFDPSSLSLKPTDQEQLRAIAAYMKQR
jgi:outer membrane protein OmpA-like peptidoglycan-associated protein